MENKNNRSNSKLRKNVTFSAIYQLLILIVPIITTPYVSRIFSPSQMGAYNLSLTVASFFVIIAQFGIETYASRLIAQTSSENNQNKVYFEMLSFQAVTTLITFILYNFIFQIVFNVDNKLLFFVQSFLIINNFLDISWFFVGIEEIKRTIFRNALTRVFTTIAIFVLIKNETHLISYALINVLGTTVGNITMVIASFKYINYEFKKFYFRKIHIRKSFGLLLPRMLSQSYSSMDSSMLMFLTSANATGIYTQSNKIINLLFAIINSAINALSPRMSYYVANKNYNNIKGLLRKGIDICSLFSVIIITGIYSVSEEFVSLFFGPGYESVADVLEISSLGIVFITLIALLSRGLLVPLSLDMEYSLSIIVSLIFGFVVNIFLIPIFGVIGASYSFILAQFFCLLYICIILRKKISMKQIFASLLISFGVILISVRFVLLIKSMLNINNLILSFLIFGVISILISVVVWGIINSMSKKLAKS